MKKIIIPIILLSIACKPLPPKPKDEGVIGEIVDSKGDKWELIQIESHDILTKWGNGSFVYLHSPECIKCKGDKD